ncbi:hypothetical protein N0B16_00030 [Chryseobacterium sp. GMJ5]|uniref:Uncharacterized protein n=1 Tax=Chryseobacterium gilvum TaxID=2976534 RepID=A0ABT2VT67_9FLAO|nr:hypothetical protein [Chryseobacterium gilvum]MCU7612818.1 hypothetical protein [Chryseobacterium gilvum]
MKKLSITIAVFCASFSFAQKVSDYKYISIPEKFTGFKNNQYGVDTALAKSLKGKKYIVISGNKSEWPEEAFSNPCSVLNADVVNDSGLLRNKIILEFKDCNNNVVSSQKANTIIKEYVEGFQDALKQALVTVPVSNPKMVISTTQVESSSTNESNESPKSSESRSAKYSNGKTMFQRVQIDGNQFILIETNESTPYATFRATTKKDVFRVKLKNGTTTIGYLEDKNIVIEMPQPNGEYSKEVFHNN